MRFWHNRKVAEERNDSFMRTAIICLCLGVSFISTQRSAVAEPPPTPATPPVIEAIPRGHGWNFVGQGGMTLYTYGNDQKKPGGSMCTEECTELWPPLLADDGAEPVGHWGFVTRDDGSRQWALDGQPVYSYADEPGPGAQFGDGYDRLWYVAELLIPTPPQMSITRTVLGRTLATGAGKTLYTPAAPCEGSCLDRWTPFKAPAVAQTPWHEWAAVNRPDGTYQWTFQGKPLYTFEGDVNASEVYGAEYDPSMWHAVVLEARPPTPDWVKPIGTDAGLMLGNTDGKVIYYYVPRRGQEDCYGYQRTCIFPEWQPLSPTKTPSPSGVGRFLSSPMEHANGATKDTACIRPRSTGIRANLGVSSLAAIAV